MFTALAIAREIVALGSGIADTVRALVKLIAGHSKETQRAAINAAYSAAERELTRKYREPRA